MDNNKMIFERIYIISWFGSDPILRKLRKQVHDQQLTWARNNGLKITVLAQEYDKDDYHSDVEYIHSNVFLRPCGARNLLFENFYASNDDFAIFADNDTIIVDDIPDMPNVLLAELRSLSFNDLKEIDFIGGINPAIQAYSDELKSQDYINNLVFKRTNRFSGGFFILKNLKKHKNITRWFDDESFTIDNKIVPGEEGDFCINLLTSGLNCFQNFQAVFNDMAGAGKSTWANTLEERTNKARFVELINKKHNRELITLINDSEKQFKYIGYSIGKEGHYKLRFCLDKAERVDVLISKNHSDIKFYDLPSSMTIKSAMEWSEKNIQDAVLQDLLKQNKGKDFKRLGNPRTRFNWNLVGHQVPNKILIPRSSSHFKSLFE